MIFRRFFSSFFNKNKFDSIINTIENKSNSKILLLTDSNRTIFHHKTFHNNDFLKLYDAYGDFYKNNKIDLVIHTIGCFGENFPKIISLLSNHNSTITAHVPYYALSGGTAFAFCANTINVSPFTLFSPCHTQIRYGNIVYPIRIYKKFFDPFKRLNYFDQRVNNVLSSIPNLKNGNDLKIILFANHNNSFPFTYRDFGNDIIKVNIDFDSKYKDLIDCFNGYHPYTNDNNEKIIIDDAYEIFKYLHIDNLTFYYQPKKINLYSIFVLTKILHNMNTNVNVHVRYNNIQQDKTIYFLLLLLSNKNIYFDKNFEFKNYFNKINYTNNDMINFELNEYFLKQTKNDLRHFLFSSDYFKIRISSKLFDILSYHQELDTKTLLDFHFPNLFLED